MRPTAAPTGPCSETPRVKSIVKRTGAALLLCGLLGCGHQPLPVLKVPSVTPRVDALPELPLSTLTIPLGIEPKNDDVLSWAPRSPSEGIINRRAAWRIAVGSALKAAGILLVFGYFHENSTVIHAQTMAFTTLVAFEWAQAIGSRSWNVPVWKLPPFSNPSLVLGMIAGVALQWIAVSSPTAEKILGTDPLGLEEWGIAIAVGLTGLVASSIMTAFDRKRGA